MDGLVDTKWYVLVDGQSYGPYSQDVMTAFVGEGRVISASLISTDAQQGFVAAGSLPVFQHWIGRALKMAQPQVQSHGAASPTSFQTPSNVRPHTQAQTTPVQTQQPVQASMQDTLFIVMAEVDPKTGMNFLRTLQSFGHVQRISDSVWLLQARHSLGEVKDALSVSLTKRDRLFVHDCFANQQAWENIGADLDGRIRQMWQAVKR